MVQFCADTAGGGLEDSGHCDVGSSLTLSVQLSKPSGGPEGGGRFTTTDASGVVTTHELERGDAVLFCSEYVHNVTTLAKDAAERNSLVIELWKSRANQKDRHH